MSSSGRDIVVVQSIRNTIMVASVLVSAALLGVMAFVGATHTMKETLLLRMVVSLLALTTVSLSSTALVLLSHASRGVQIDKVENDWRRAHICVIFAAITLILFAAGALYAAIL